MPYSHKRSPEKRKERKEKFKAFEQKKSESDTIRGIVKDLNQRDLLTGEIIYCQTNEAAVKQALAIGVYSIEVAHIESKHVKSKPERILLPISQEAIDQINFEYGEVLNRAVEPCWWR